MRKHRLPSLIAAVALFFMLAGAAQAALPARVTFATLPTGSGNNAMATALAKVASDHSGILVVTRPGSSHSAWVTSTSERGSPELGFAHILDVWWGFSGKLSPTPLPGDPYGTAPFYTPSPNLRMLIAGPGQRVGMVVRRDAPWQNLTDAKGQSVAGGFTAHAGAYSSLVAAMMAENLLESRDFKLVPVPSVGASIGALTEGRADIAVGGVGTAPIAEANSRTPVRFLNVPHDAESQARVKQAFPGAEVALFTGRAPGVTEDTWLVTYPLIVTASTHLSEAAAYALVKSWWENYEETRAMHASFADWGPDKFMIRNATIPFHDGAIRFFKEKGIWDADMDRIQAELLAGEFPFLK